MPATRMPALRDLGLACLFSLLASTAISNTAFDADAAVWAELLTEIAADNGGPLNPYSGGDSAEMSLSFTAFVSQLMAELPPQPDAPAVAPPTPPAASAAASPTARQAALFQLTAELQNARAVLDDPSDLLGGEGGMFGWSHLLRKDDSDGLAASLRIVDGAEERLCSPPRIEWGEKVPSACVVSEIRVCGGWAAVAVASKPTPTRCTPAHPPSHATQGPNITLSIQGGSCTLEQHGGGTCRPLRVVLFTTPAACTKTHSTPV